MMILGQIDLSGVSGCSSGLDESLNVDAGEQSSGSVVPTIVIKLEPLPSDKCSDELETVPGVTSEIEIEN
jgi:hypothetical protein